MQTGFGEGGQRYGRFFSIFRKTYLRPRVFDAHYFCFHNFQNMKNLKLLFAAATLLLAAACNNIDKQFVGQMRESLLSTETAATGMEATGTALGEMNALLEAAPTEMKADSAFGEVQRKATAFAQKHQATMAEYGDLTARLNTLIADYSAGKIKSDAAHQEFEVLGGGLESMKKAFEDISSLSDDLQAEYGKMKAAWSAAQEEAQ
jgi:uncharacterized protein YukE